MLYCQSVISVQTRRFENILPVENDLFVSFNMVKIWIWCFVFWSMDMYIDASSIHHDYLEFDDFSDFLDNVQSPIAISFRDSIKLDDMIPLEFHGHWKNEGNATLLNTGKTAKVKFRGRTKQPYIAGEPLKTDGHYVFEQMHFHWGKTDRRGSEHVIDGQTHSMEAHLVYYNSIYGDFKKAANVKDGLAVVAFFIQARDEMNYREFSKITNYIPNIHEALTKHTISSECLKWMKSIELSKHYYSYHGSLTTPPYSECVTWIIFQSPIYVSRKQVDVFRHLRSKNNERILSNNRPLQRPHKLPTVIYSRNTKSNSFF